MCWRKDACVGKACRERGRDFSDRDALQDRPHQHVIWRLRLPVYLGSTSTLGKTGLQKFEFRMQMQRFEGSLWNVYTKDSQSLLSCLARITAGIYYGVVD